MTRRKPSPIGARIRRFREERGLTPTQLATAAKISRSYLWSLENEPAAVRPSGNTLYKIAEALGVTMSDLLGRKVLLDDAPGEIPESLREFADEAGLPERDVRMLAAIRFRDTQPRTKERWRYIYEAIQTSRILDERPR